MFGLCIPVSSLQYQLVGKLLVNGSLPKVNLVKIDLLLVFKVDELFE